jgi:hypothetical protein
MTDGGQYQLRAPANEAEWQSYHEIRRAVLWEARGQGSVYDRIARMSGYRIGLLGFCSSRMAGYIRSIPEDPMTGKRDWKVTIGEDPKLAKGPKGVVDAHSSSSAKSSGGTPYSEW